MELTESTVATYLEDRGHLPTADSATVTPLGGGVSNRVLAVHWDEAGVVVKQPLPELAVSDHWPADVARVHNEAAAMRVVRDMLEEIDDAPRVPEILFEDRDIHAIGMECAPTIASSWKEALLAGDVDAAIAGRLGEILGVVHRKANDNEAIREQFSHTRPFEQLRLDPYHRTVARRHPDLAERIQIELERLMRTQTTLVHGDFSPKNVLVEPGDGTPRLWLIDFEVAHWGDPAFDVAFMLNHLTIKSVFNHERQAQYLDAADRFYASYTASVPWSVEPALFRELGILMLARVDGKSPVEYVTNEKTREQLRRIAHRVLTQEPQTLDDVRTYVEMEVNSS